MRYISLNPAKVIFGKPVLSFKSVHDEVLAISCTLQNVACSFTLTHSLYLLILPLLYSANCEMRTLTGRKEDSHTFSLNTLNLNSLLIRRYVTSLTLPSSPSFSPPIPCAHPRLVHSSVSPSALRVSFLPSFLPRLYLLVSLHFLYLFFPSPFFSPLGACPFRGTCEHSTAPLKTVSNLKVN